MKFYPEKKNISHPFTFKRILSLEAKACSLQGTRHSVTFARHPPRYFNNIDRGVSNSIILLFENRGRLIL